MELLDLSVKFDDNIASNELVTQAEQLLEITERASSLYKEFANVEIHVWVEQGSITKRTKWFIGLTTLLNVVSNIDSVIGGLEKICTYSEKAMAYIAQEVAKPTPYKVSSVKRSAGLPQKITEILHKVQRGKYSPEEATQCVMRLIESEDADSNSKESFFNSFRAVAEQSYRAPWVQLPLFPGMEIESEVKPDPSKKRKPKVPVKEISLQGVELWYDKKTGRREIRRYTKK